MTKRLRIHPGEVLREEFMIPLGLSANRLAAALDVPTNRVTALLNSTRGVTADTALRLARHFDTTPQFWMNLQSAYDLSLAEKENGEQIKKRVETRAA